MPSYFLHVRTPDHVVRPRQRHDFPDLGQALAAAHGAARTLLGGRARVAGVRPRGTVDVEDERGQPVARILLADVARQIS
jgi:hypothetical protein